MITMGQLPLSGPLSDSQLTIIEIGGVLVEDGQIIQILGQDEFKGMQTQSSSIEMFSIKKKVCWSLDL
jgi:hypothetical protein